MDQASPIVLLNSRPLIEPLSGTRGLKLRDFKLKGLTSNGSSSNDGQDVKMKSDRSRFSQSNKNINEGSCLNNARKDFIRP